MKNPAIFLKKMQDEAAEKTKHVKELALQMEKDVVTFKTYGEVLLFREEFSDIKGCRYHSVIPRPYFIISGLEIVAIPWHNNNFSQNISCKVDVRIKLLIEHDRSEEHVYFDDNPALFWNCNIASFKMEENKCREESLGVLTNREKEREGSWDSKLLILNAQDFPIFKEVVKRGLTAIGVEFE